MNHLVQILVDDDGNPTDDKSWHLVSPAITDGNASLCSSEYFGFGESQCEYNEKYISKGGITCEKCLNIIREMKRVRL